MEYSKEKIKEVYEDDLKEIYRAMLEKEEEKLETLNKELNELKYEMLHAIAKYDVATHGGKSKDVNTLMVQIITEIEKFRACNEDANRKKKEQELQGNIFALNRLLNM